MDAVSPSQKAPAYSENRTLRLAGEFVQHTGCHVFLTGKAGTGKTTFLHNLKRNTAKRMIVTAPTGVAAVNAGGVTLHSFFQLPFGPFIPGGGFDETHARKQFRFSREKKRMIKSLDLLVIDEISMVRADLLDSVDAVLRLHRRDERPFGGVQLLMIGDLHQLSPVAREDDWRLLRQYYESVYFFSSHALGRTEFVTVELDHIFRQTDARFIRLLNRVRENRLDEDAVKDLNTRYVKGFSPEEGSGYITLTTHNKKADTINDSRLAALKKKEYRFEAQVTGDFPEHAYPAPGVLTLKEGAQVMFLRNDASAEKRFYNGKIGRIETISDEHIGILCPDDPEEIPVEPMEWKNIKYSVNEADGEIREEVIGAFQQFPLKTAWAVTVHKSQGLTFERAVIDVESAFAHGQVYVALSRCKTLEGIVLSSPIPSRGIDTDDAVLGFVESARQAPPTEDRLQAHRISHQQRLLLNCFDFQALGNRLHGFLRIVHGNAGNVRLCGASEMERLPAMAGEHILTVSEKFKRQLRARFEENRLPETDDYVQERVRKASEWFREKLCLVFDEFMRTFRLETDNREIEKKIGDALNDLKQALAVKQAGIASCRNGFSPPLYLRSIAKAEIEFTPEKIKKPKPPEYDESGIEHAELLQNLKDWRSRKARELGVAHFQILHQRILFQIAEALPGSTSDLGKIKGVGTRTIQKQGKEILSLVAAYRGKHGIGEKK